MKEVLLIGHCDLDNPQITSLIKDHFSANVTRVKLLKDAKKFFKKDKYDLAVINRIGAFDQEKGIDLITELIKDGCCRDTPLMMVTNYEDHMKRAIENGAVPGFGKNNLFKKKTIELLGKYLM